MKRPSNEDILDFIETQLAVWPMAKKNYDALAEVKRRKLKVGSFDMALQFNPARMVSTGADLSAEHLKERRCFLCASNRPPEQMAIEILPGWDLCVNPYPIFPIHFTVVSKNHEPQERVPDAIVSAVDVLPDGLCVFFNGSKAGASAPDHLHMQAVLKDELPLVSHAENMHRPSDSKPICTSFEGDPDFPFLYVSGIISGPEDMKVLIAGLNCGGPDSNGELTDPSSVNTFFWKDDSGYLRFAAVPRICHRPSHYFKEGEGRIMISPGCVDMAGVFILPREEDFNKITPAIAGEIFQDTALT